MKELLAEYFCLSIRQLTYLAFGEISPTKERGMLATVSRIPTHLYGFKWADEDSKGPRTWAVGLSAAGVAYARRHGFATGATKPLTEHSRRTVPHELDVSDAHIRTADMADHHGLDLYWRQVDLRRSIYPDAIFSLSYAHLPAAKNTRHFTLDIENNPFSKYENGVPKIIRRVLQYIKYAESGKARKEYGHPIYRYIFLFESAASMNTVLRKIREEYGTDAPNYIWFATKEQYTQLCDAEIFKTPQDYEKSTHSILHI